MAYKPDPFAYVEDEIEGIYRLLMSDYHLPVNIGNPDEITILDFAQEIIALTGTDQKIVFTRNCLKTTHYSESQTLPKPKKF